MKRIQRKRTKGWKMPTNTVYVGRPTKWGNPFMVGGHINAWGKAFIAIQKGKTPDGIREVYKSGIFDKAITFKQSLEWYRMWLDFRIKNKNLNLEELRGKNLACFCPLSYPCHADILIKAATQHNCGNLKSKQ